MRVSSRSTTLLPTPATQPEDKADGLTFKQSLAASLDQSADGAMAGAKVAPAKGAAGHGSKEEKSQSDSSSDAPSNAQSYVAGPEIAVPPVTSSALMIASGASEDATAASSTNAVSPAGLDFSTMATGSLAAANVYSTSGTVGVGAEGQAGAASGDGADVRVADDGNGPSGPPIQDKAAVQDGGALQAAALVEAAGRSAAAQMIPLPAAAGRVSGQLKAAGGAGVHSAEAAQAVTASAGDDAAGFGANLATQVAADATALPMTAAMPLDVLEGNGAGQPSGKFVEADGRAQWSGRHAASAAKSSEVGSTASAATNAHGGDTAASRTQAQGGQAQDGQAQDGQAQGGQAQGGQAVQHGQTVADAAAKPVGSDPAGTENSSLAAQQVAIHGAGAGQPGGDGHGAVRDGADGVRPSANGETTASGADGDGTTARASINTASLIQTVGGSEMRVGMHSSEFGNVSIRTSVNDRQMLAQISTDHSDLGQAISTHVAAAQTKLGDDLGLRTVIEVNQQPAGSFGDPGRSATREDAAATKASRAEASSAETDTGMTAGLLTATNAGYRLDIQA